MPTLHTLHVMQVVFYAALIVLYAFIFYAAIARGDRRSILLNGLILFIWIITAGIFVLGLQHGGG